MVLDSGRGYQRSACTFELLSRLGNLLCGCGLLVLLGCLAFIECVCGFDFGRFVFDVRARPRALSTPSFWTLSRRTAGGIRRSRSSVLFWMERRISTARCTPTARSSRSCCMSTRPRLSTVSIRRGCARSLPARRAPRFRSLSRIACAGAGARTAFTRSLCTISSRPRARWCRTSA